MFTQSGKFINKTIFSAQKLFSQPKSGVFCALINEARQTIPLEMPDKENTFVLKANEQEYVIEAKDAAEMKSWLATIRYCMKSTPTSQNMPPLPQNINDSSNNTSLTNACHGGEAAGAQASSSSATTSDSTLNNSLNHNNTNNNNNVNSTNNNNQPELPPRRPESSGHFHLEEEDLLHDSDLTAMMSEYPWWVLCLFIFFCHSYCLVKFDSLVLIRLRIILPKNHDLNF